MTKKAKPARPEFRTWVDEQAAQNREPMPLTHIARAVTAQDILRAGAVEPGECEALGARLAYFFYGRPAYRAADGNSVKIDRSCPFCFIFDQRIIKRASVIHAFDTGAFEANLYGHVLPTEVNVGDFSLERDVNRPDKLIARVFGSRVSYFDMDLERARAVQAETPAYDLLPRSYLDLLVSATKNEPDDRVGTIEVAFSDPVLVSEGLKAIVVPHTMWSQTGKAPWLLASEATGVKISPYKYLPGRAPEYYQGLVEAQVRHLFEGWDVL